MEVNFINKIFKYLMHPSYLLMYLDNKRVITLDDTIYLNLIYKKCMKKKLNLKNPKSFNEKIQWLKLYDRNPEYIKMVDKYEVKKYVSNIIGEEYVIPTIGVYDKFEDIDFKELPNQFVIKVTHDSGGVIICKDKNILNLKDAKNKINKSLKNNFFYLGREWPYKNVKPRIIIEEYIEDANDLELRDYKFFCFNGIAKTLFVATDRQKDTETCFDFFDMNYNHLDVKNGHPNAEINPHKPKNFKKMIELAEALSYKIPHVRVDFYEVNGKIYFGEMTFYHWSGLVPFEPEEFDQKLGDLIKLPERKNKGEK